MTAIYYKDQKITYKELLNRIQDHKIVDPIFPVTNTLECVISVLSCLIKVSLSSLILHSFLKNQVLLFLKTATIFYTLQDRQK